MQPDEIIRIFEAAPHTFPRQAMEAAIANREAMIPGLLRVLEHTVDHAQELADKPNYPAHFFAAYLLAQFREPRAYPLLIRLFSYPTGILEALWSDVVTEAANRILASVCGGDIEPIKALAENPQAGEYARSAALRSLLVLVAQGDKSREEILDYYRSLFRRLPRTDDFIWSSLASAATDLYPNVLYADIRQAFDDDLIDPFYINQGDVDQVMAQGLQPTLQALKEDPFNDYIVDAIAELEMWAAFQPDISPPPVSPYLWPPPPASTTFVREGPKIGRNEPCPCGSGLKYKRCCGRKK